MARFAGTLKLAAAAALVAVLGAGAALVALKAFLPEAKLRAMIENGARKQLGREVRLSGVSVGLTGLHVRGLEVSERPDFAAGTFVSVESFSLRPSWRALLKKKLVVASASADGLKLRVVKAADGSFNSDSLASTTAAPSAPAKPADADAPSFDVRHLRVRRGSVEYKDEAAGAAWTVDDLDLALDDFSLGAPFALDVSLHAKGVAGARPVDARLSFAGTVDPARGDKAKMAFDFRRLVVEQDGVKLSAKGKVRSLTAPDADLEATVAVSGKAVLEVTGRGKKGETTSFDVSFRTPGLDTTLVAKWLPSSGVPALKVPAVEGAAAGTWDGTDAELKSFRAKWSGGEVEGSGSAKGVGSDKPVYAGRAKLGVDVPAVAPGEYPFLKLPPKASLPAMRVDGLVVYGGDAAEFSPLSAKMKQGTVVVSGKAAKLSSAKPALDLAVKVDLDLPPIAASDLPVELKALPAGFVLPAMKAAGGLKVKGDDVVFDDLRIKGKSGNLTVDGAVAKALAGAPDPDVTLKADLDLPPLTDKDLPNLAAVPPGLALPASKWAADLSYTPRQVRIKTLAVKIASNELSVEGGVSDPGGRGAFDLLLKCKHFKLDELTQMTPRTRDLKLAGSGFFALSVTGTKEKPVFGGKLQFSGLGATVGQLALADFGGTVSFDERRIDVPNLKGGVNDGRLTMDLTVKDYAKSPEIQLDATLDRFDLEKYLEAKKKFDADNAAAKAAKAAREGKAVEQKPSTPLRTRGKLAVGEILLAKARAEKVTATWDLYGLTPDLKTLSGDAKLVIDGGKMKDVAKMTLPPIVRTLLFPILIFQKIGLGVDLNDITIAKFFGDYLFKDGLMTLRQSELDADKVRVAATGTIDLPTEALDMTTTANIGNLPQAEVAVGGTMSAPKTKFKVGKLLENAGRNLLEGLLRK